jgi:dienelactone hydrolase
MKYYSVFFLPWVMLASPSMADVVSHQLNHEFLDRILARKCSVETVMLEPDHLQVRIYTPKHKSPSELRTILIEPPTGGENPLDLMYARHFCRKGFQSVIIEHWSGDTTTATDFGMHDRAMVAAINAVKQTLDYISAARPTQVGIMGTSLGSLITAVTLGFEPRLQTAAIIVGGGDLAEINAKSDEKSLINLRETRMKDYGINSITDYQTILKSHIQYDPLVSISKSSVKNIYMMIGMKDLTVPTANQLKLRDVTSEHTDLEVHYFSGNHFETILGTWATQSTSLTKFFDRNLN